MQLGVLFGSQLMGGFGMRLAFMGASIVGSMLLNGKKKPQGKLNDLRVSSSTYGRGIPIVYGTMRVTGNMFWATDFVEEKYYMTQKGKRKTGSMGKKKEAKGKATPMYEYFANFAMGLCEGPIESLLRIWADNNLIYDKLNPNNEDLEEIGFTTRDDDDEGGKRAAKSPARKKGSQGDSGRFQFRLYSGTEDQLPDSFMVAKQGADKVPAYRGLCYLMFERFALADFGNRTPTITAEVSVKSQRRPMYSALEPMEPNDEWEVPVLPPVCIDPIRSRLYHQASTSLPDKRFIRVYDLNRGMEIKRLSLDPADLPIPSSAVLSTYTTMNGIMTEQTTLRNITAADYSEWIGVAANGDLVFNSSEGTNFSPIMFCDPDTLRVKSAFGTAGTIGQGWEKSILEATAAFAIVGTDTSAQPTPFTAVRGIFGDSHLFDQENRLVGYVETPRTKRISPGVPGTEAGIFITTSATYGGRESIYTAPASGRYAVVQNGVKVGEGGTQSTAKLLYEWPPEGGVGNSYINYTGYSAGANALGLICEIRNSNPTLAKGTYAVKVDRTTGDELWRQFIGPNFLSPDQQFLTPNYMGGGSTAWIEGDRCYIVDFRAQDVSTFFIANMAPKQTFGEFYYSDLDALLYYAGEHEGGKWVLFYFNRKTQVPITVADICRDVSRRVGIPDERINTDAMVDGEEITGYMIEQPTEARSVLEDLGNVFMFDAVESDNVLKFKTRGSSSIVTIPQEDLGVVETDFGGENEYYVETRFQETELPERVNVSFINPEEKYETGTMHYKRPQRPINVMGSRELLEVTLNMAMTPNKAKTLAQRILFAAWSERTSHEYALPLDYLKYDPSDVITIELENGQTFQDRITDIEIGDDFSMRLTTVSQIASTYQMLPPFDPDKPGGVIPIPGGSGGPTTKALIHNIPYLSNEDVSEGGQFTYYWTAGAYAVGFRFGALVTKIGNGSTEIEAYTNADGIWGYTDITVPPPPDEGTLFDYDTEITLTPAFDFNEFETVYTWDSIADEEWPSEENMVVIGDEVILFKTVVENPDGSVTISELVRGYRGTAHAANFHQSGETWTLVLPLSFQQATEDMNHVGVETGYMIQSTSPLPPLMTKVNDTLDAASRKPWQVGDVRRTNTSGTPGAIRVDWRRATRYGGDFLNGTGTVPLNEEVEKYEVFLLKAPYDPQTWDPADVSLYWHQAEDLPTALYTFDSATLTAAGLTYQSDISVVIYQMSGSVGRGFPRGITLGYSIFGI